MSTPPQPPPDEAQPSGQPGKPPGSHAKHRDWLEAARLATGTLTVFPVALPRVDRTVAARAMVLAPLVGLLLAVPAGLVLWLADLVGAAPLLTAALVIAALAALTRAMHLDGLADTADGLGSGKPPADALAIMRRGDVGPFGVVTLVLALLVQVAALAQLVVAGAGVAGLTVGLVMSRLALPQACLRGVGAARPEGLGSIVAGSVSRTSGLVSLALAYAAVSLTLLALQPPSWLALLVVAPVGTLAGLGLAAHAVRRLGGITGDVLGAAVETAFTAGLVALALATV